MSLAQTFSESFEEAVSSSARSAQSPAGVANMHRPRREGWDRLRRGLAHGVGAGLELACFLGVGGMMAAGALLLR